MEPSFPFAHDSAINLCACCGAPELPGVACLCTEEAYGLIAALTCMTCGAVGGDYEATCPECRRIGRVDLSAYIPGDPIPPRELKAEEPLPTDRRSSWWPVAC